MRPIPWKLGGPDAGLRLLRRRSDLESYNEQALPSVDMCGRHSSFDREVLIAAQADLAGEGREPDGAGRRTGDVEEGLAGLGVQIAVILFRAAMGAMVGKAGCLGAGVGDGAEAWPVPGIPWRDGSCAARRHAPRHSTTSRGPGSMPCRGGRPDRRAGRLPCRQHPGDRSGRKSRPSARRESFPQRDTRRLS